MEAESTCQCLSSSSRHGKIHHDLHKFDILFPVKKKNQSLRILLLLLLPFFLRQKHWNVTSEPASSMQSVLPGCHSGPCHNPPAALSVITHACKTAWWIYIAAADSTCFPHKKISILYRHLKQEEVVWRQFWRELSDLGSYLLAGKKKLFSDVFNLRQFLLQELHSIHFWKHLLQQSVMCTARRTSMLSVATCFFLASSFDGCRRCST
jgi:hypothetical protein